jgi:leucyl aminopeptidase
MRHNIQFIPEKKKEATDAVIAITSSPDIQLPSDYFVSSEVAYIKKRTESGEECVTLQSHESCKFAFSTDASAPINKTKEKARIQAAAIYKKLIDCKCTSATLYSSLDNEITLAFIEGIALSAYTFDKYKTNKKEQDCLKVFIESSSITKSDIDRIESVCDGVFVARDLVNEPVSSLNATQLAEIAASLGKKYNFGVKTLVKSEIEQEKMGGLLGVNKGSVAPPTFTILEWSPSNTKDCKTIVLVGKGVTFDTGGINLKVHPGGLDDMKSDMAGAAAVIGTFVAIAQTEAPVRLIGLIPATDNRPGFEAMVPGDVITMHDGTTVEIMNTDAEGRLILADAISYSKQYDPQLVIELSTLTGSAVMTLGNQGMAAMGTADDETFGKLEESGNSVGERLARFPFWDEYGELIKSDVADLKNIGGREAGAITAGKFLAHFAKHPFIHLDIAGVAYARKDNGYRGNGASGVGVRLLTDFISGIH